MCVLEDVWNATKAACGTALVARRPWHVACLATDGTSGTATSELLENVVALFVDDVNALHGRASAAEDACRSRI